MGWVSALWRARAVSDVHAQGRGTGVIMEGVESRLLMCGDPHVAGWTAPAARAVATDAVDATTTMRLTPGGATAAGMTSALSPTTTTSPVFMATSVTTTVWSPAPSARQAVFEAQGATANGRLYSFGGFNGSLQATRTSYAFNPATHSWSRVADLPTKVTHAGVAVDGGRIWIVGGLVGDYPNNPATRDVWRYDTKANAYSRGPSLPSARGAGALVRLGRRLHYFGGLKADGTDAATHYVLNLDGGTAWRTAAPLPNARNHLGGAALNGRVYAIGGQHRRDETYGNQTSVHAYDPGTNTWKSVASLAKPRSHFGSSTVVANGSIWIIGGVTQGRTPLSDVSRYDPAANRWATMASIPAARKAPVAGLLGTKLYVTTGSSGDAAPQVTSWVRTV